MIAAFVIGTLAVAGIAISIDDDDNAAETASDPVDEPASGPNNQPTDSHDLLQFDGDDDEIDAGSGYDTVHAGGGDDSVSAGLGKDVVYGEGGDDSVSGGEFHDILYGNSGDDQLNGDGGLDALFGGGGQDTLDGGGWNDHLDGGNGADSLMGGLGNDELIGVNHNRVLTAEEIAAIRDEDNPDLLEDYLFTTEADGADTLDGGAGDDYLALGKGDIGTGGEGIDEFELHLSQDGAGIITITDYDAAEDVVQIVLDDDSVTINPDDYTVERDEETGDALILERGEVVSRLLGAGDTFTAENLMLIGAV